MKRRDFLKYQLTGALYLAAGGLVWPGAGLAESFPDVAVAKGGPAAATRAAVGLVGGMGRFVSPGDRVLIKPNMSFPNPPEAATTTNPEVVATLMAMCLEAGASRVTAVDHPLGDVTRCLDVSGIRPACRAVAPDSVFCATAASLYRETEFPRGKDMKTNEVVKEALAADKLIAAPVAKSHSGAGVSLSMKGMMGLVFNRGVMHWRYDLDEAIVDLASFLTPDLVVIDATRVLSTGGPGGPGKVLKEDTVIASDNMVSADAEAVSRFTWYGRRYKPAQVGHIRIAHQRGLGRMDVENLKVEEVVV